MRKMNKRLLGTFIVMNSMMIPQRALAATGFNQVQSGLNTIKSLVINIVMGIGVIIIAKEALEMGTAIKQQDTSSIASAIKGMIGGALMVCVGTIITIFGGTA